MSDKFEEKNVVYKSEYTDKIRRAVVAFANSDGGKIYVGVDDFGQVVGLSDVEDVRRRVVKLIQDGISPDVTPYVECAIERAEGKSVVAVEVSRGAGRPYWLNDAGLNPNGVLVRSDAASVPSTPREIARLIDETSGGDYETSRSIDQNLTFQEATEVFKRRNMRLDRQDLLELGLVDAWGTYTNLAYLLSDQCDPTIKVAIETDDSVRSREIVEPRGSLFAQLDGAIAALDRFNRKFVKTLDGREISAREYREFPAEALNEAIVNAIVCRDYSKPISTLIRLYADRVEILSYGALVDGIDAKDLPLGVSASRNPKLAGVFRRLRYIDSLGQGLAGIRKIYQGSGVEPKFEISDNFFRVTLFNAFERRLERVVVSEEAKPRFVPVVDAPATVASQTFVPELTERTNVVAIGTDKALTVIADNPTSGAVKFRRERRYRD